VPRDVPHTSPYNTKFLRSYNKRHLPLQSQILDRHIRYQQACSHHQTYTVPIQSDLGVHHHTDAGALTVLIQDDVGGLQVHRDGYWYDIPPVEGAIVINTGDMMQVWSNDTYHAPVHRVLAMDACDRYSLPFFFNPSAQAQVSPLPTVVNEQNPNRYNPIEWGRFRGKRSDGDYADYGTEVQIAQFRK
jgi:isopenicillin N synthase-like dioxygenase